MKKALCLVLISTIVCTASVASANQGRRAEEAKAQRMTASPGFLYRQVSIQTKGGEIISGLLVGMTSSGLILRTGESVKTVDVKNMSKVKIAKEPKRGRAALTGTLLGIYLGNLLFCRSKNQPTAYIPDFGVLISRYQRYKQIIFSAAGCGLGYILNSILEKEPVTFDFTEGEDNRQAEWDRMRKFIAGAEDFGSRKVHLAVHGGAVFFNVFNRYEDFFNKSGYFLADGDYFGPPGRDSHAEVASATNLLRRLQLTVSVAPGLETGAAVMSLGEPSISGAIHQKNQSITAGVELAATGYYAVALYQPLRRVRHLPVQWRVGAGLGGARVDFIAWSDLFYHTTQTQWDKYTEHQISKWFPSAAFLTDFQIYLSSSLSLGLSVDFAWIPSQHVPAFPDAGIPAQKLTFGNVSAGLMFAFHF